MNLNNIFNNEEKEIMEKIAHIENKEYSKEDIYKIQSKIIDDIMSNSKKDIEKLREMYSSILNKLD